MCDRTESQYGAVWACIEDLGLSTLPCDLANDEVAGRLAAEPGSIWWINGDRLQDDRTAIRELVGELPTGAWLAVTYHPYRGPGYDKYSISLIYRADGAGNAIAVRQVWMGTVGQPNAKRLFTDLESDRVTD